MKRKKRLSEDKVRVIKIGKEALFEFIYEKFIDDQDTYFDVDPLKVTDTFDINLERGEFIFCVHKLEDKDGNFINLPEEIDLQQLMKNIPDTTTTMYADGRYKEFTKAVDSLNKVEADSAKTNIPVDSERVEKLAKNAEEKGAKYERFKALASKKFGL
jgi:hypothetical protein